MAMIQLPSDFKEFLKLLNSHRVEYLLVSVVTPLVIMAIRVLPATWIYGWQFVKTTPKSWLRS